MLILRAVGPRRAAGGAWLATTVATVASTYALDGFAVAIGGLLVASGILAGLPVGPLCGCLLVSYLLWGASLRLSLAANWSMLSATGVSSNAFSKAAHDLARARGASARRRRLAASAGYVLTEIAKELPYYLGAAGAALVSDALTSRDALIFLAGTNVGAAIYEYALARATRVFLQQTAARRIRPGIPPPAPEGGRHRAARIRAGPRGSRRCRA